MKTYKGHSILDRRTTARTLNQCATTQLCLQALLLATAIAEIINLIWY